MSAIGNTPLVRLSKILKDVDLRLYAKLESLNLGGSIKDRPALNIIKHGIETGLIHPNTVIVESSSGNMGIGLAQVCAYFGLRFICVIDPKTTEQNIRILEVFGADIDLVMEPDPQTGEYLQARLNRVKELCSVIPDSFWPNQYANEANAIAHYHTMGEIAKELNDKVDYLFCAVSTCGTLRGCAEYVRNHHLPTHIVAVDAYGSVIFGGSAAKRLIPGHGAAVVPPLYDPDLADQRLHVTDLECVIGCRRLVRHESLLVGGSSGAVLMAIEQVKHTIPPGSVVVAIFPDRGERYMETIYSDRWVAKHFGDVAHLWQDDREARNFATASDARA
ncbi:MAG TPA: 2,3-diaminopropionate biosynthesis protein SbnA [Pyrinomonadaceae bacterium]|nr:2,3-diaminopropionate biosynthesis protein SbnA [Pyrinomonadaceae bacterium]